MRLDIHVVSETLHKIEKVTIHFRPMLKSSQLLHERIRSIRCRLTTPNSLVHSLHIVKFSKGACIFRDVRFLLVETISYDLMRSIPNSYSPSRARKAAYLITCIQPEPIPSRACRTRAGLAIHVRLLNPRIGMLHAAMDDNLCGCSTLPSHDSSHPS